MCQESTMKFSNTFGAFNNISLILGFLGINTMINIGFFIRDSNSFILFFFFEIILFCYSMKENEHEFLCRSTSLNSLNTFRGFSDIHFTSGFFRITTVIIGRSVVGNSRSFIENLYYFFWKFLLLLFLFFFLERWIRYPCIENYR